MDTQGHFSQPDLRLASPSYEHSTEAIDDSGTQGPDPLGSIFSQLTLQQVAEVQRTGDHLLLRNLATFLEKYSGTWKVSGFWNAPSWNTTESSNIALQPNCSGLMTYRVGLHNESDIHDVKLRLARVSLFLFFEREIECEHNRGTAKTTLKKRCRQQPVQLERPGISGEKKTSQVIP